MPTPITPDLDTLVALFYEQPELLGEFDEVAAEQMPSNYRRLLAHDAHMTVTVEEFHNSPVDVVVVDKRITPQRYARKILLTRQSDGAVVQYGIMRVSFAHLDQEVEADIRSERIPLGRVLINHNVLRQVRLSSLYRVEPGPELAELFQLARPATTYGRTATIECNGEPAIELIEIVAPLLQ